MEFGIAGLARAELIAQIPDAAAAPRVEARPLLQFDQLYDAPTLDDRMLAAFAPTISDSGILDPMSCTEALDAVHGSLTDLARRANDADRALLQDALAVLDRVQDNRSLLESAYRALMRG